MTTTDGTLPVGDSAAKFYESVWPLAGLVMRLATLVVPDHAQAEELAHQTLLEAARTIDRRGDADWRMWVLGILHKRRREQLQNAGVAPVMADDRWTPAPPSQSETIAADPKEVLASLSDEQVLMAIRALPEETRWAVLLLDVVAMPESHAAVVLDLPVWTIESHAKQAHQVLRDVLVPLAAVVNSARQNQVFERR